MSEMIEELARKLSGVEPSGNYWHDLARTAIEAMREPTADMIDVGRDVGPDAPYGVDETYKRWQAMIDEALKDQ